MAVTTNTPQAFTARLARMVGGNLPGWQVVSDIADNRETRDKYIVIHAGEATPAANVPASNRTMRLPVTVVAGWSPSATMDDDLLTAQFVGTFNDFFSGHLGSVLGVYDPDIGQEPPAAETDMPGWVLIDWQAGFPVTGTDGVYYSVSVVFNLILQF